MNEALTPADAAAAADELWRRIRDVVEEIGPEGWHLPTPCARWDVSALVAHLAAAGGAYYGMPQPAPPDGWVAPEGLSPLDRAMEAGVAARADRSREQLVDELADVHAAHVDALAALPDLAGEVDGPTGRMDQAALFDVRMFDMWHHLWDLHQAGDLPFDIDDRSSGATACHAYVVRTTPWLFGKQAGAPDDAAVRLTLGPPLSWDRSVAVIDGRARWVDEDAEDRVVGPPAAYSLLLTGRVDRAGAEALGLAGRGAEADRLLGARMFR